MVVGLNYLCVSIWSIILGLRYSFMVRFNLYYPVVGLESIQIYNSSFTRHGVVIVFFYLVPLVFSVRGNWIFTWIVNLNDLAHPRINLLSLHFLLASLIPFLLHCFRGFLETAWTFYPPLSTYRGGNSIELMVLSLHLNGLSSLLGAYNFVSTFVRAGWGKWDIVVFRVMATSILLLTTLPSVIVCLSIVLLDRKLSSRFFGNLEGGEVMVYLHLFWWFGHPEVYVTALPAFGLVTYGISRLAPFPSYKERAYSVRVVRIVGLAVWAHHMFLDIDWDRRYFFSFMSLLVGLPTGSKILTWLQVIFAMDSTYLTDTSMFITLIFITIFSFGGFTGLVVGCVGVDYFFHDTYYVVAHFHFVISLAASVGFTSGFNVLLPELSRISPISPNFVASSVIVFIFSNLTFIPIHFLGFYAIPRRYRDYSIGLTCFNFFSSLGSTLNVMGTRRFLWDCMFELLSMVFVL